MVALVLGRQTPIRAQGPASPGALRDIQPCSRRGQPGAKRSCWRRGSLRPPGDPPWAPREPSLSVFQAGVGVDSIKHKCQSSESSANTPRSCGVRGQKGWSLDPGQGRAAGSEVLAPSSSLTVDTAGGGVGVEGARELSNFCCLLPARARGLRDTHRDTHTHTHTDSQIHTQRHTHTDTHTDTHRHTETHTQTHTEIYRHTDSQRHSHGHRLTETHSQTHTEICRHTQTHTHKQTHRCGLHTQTHTHRDVHYTHTYTDTHRETHTDTHTRDTHKEIQTHTETHTQRHTQRQKHTETHTETTHTQTHRDTHRDTQKHTHRHTHRRALHMGCLATVMTSCPSVGTSVRKARGTPS